MDLNEYRKKYVTTSSQSTGNSSRVDVNKYRKRISEIYYENQAKAEKEKADKLSWLYEKQKKDTEEYRKKLSAMLQNDADAQANSMRQPTRAEYLASKLNAQETVDRRETPSDRRRLTQQAEWYKKYNGKSYKELEDALERVTSKDEYNWIKQYQQSGEVMTAADYARRLGQTQKAIDALGHNDTASFAGTAMGGAVINRGTTAQRKELQAEYNKLLSGYYYKRNEEQIARAKADKENGGRFESAMQNRKDADRIQRVLAGISANEFKFDDDYKYISEKYGLTQESSGGLEQYSNDLQALLGELGDEFVGSSNRLERSGDYDVNAAYRYEQMRQDELEYYERLKRINELADAPGGKLAGNIASVVTAPLKLLDLAATVASTMGHNDTSDINNYEPINKYNMPFTQFSNTIRERTSENIDSKALKFLYQTGMSMAESMAMVTTLGPLTNLVFGGSAAADFIYNNAGSGASNNQILAGATAAGVAEAFFEEFSLENLMKFKDVSTLSQFIKQWLTQGGVEASEEIFTEISNIITDTLIMGDFSETSQAVKRYMEKENMSLEEARKKAMLDNIANVGMAGLGGLVSGIGMGALYGGPQYISNRISQSKADKRYAQSVKSTDSVDALIESGMESPESTESRKQAEALKAKVDAGQQIRDRDIAKLAKANQTQVESENKKTADEIRSYGKQLMLGEDISNRMTATYFAEDSDVDPFTFAKEYTIVYENAKKGIDIEDAFKFRENYASHLSNEAIRSAYQAATVKEAQTRLETIRNGEYNTDIKEGDGNYVTGETVYLRAGEERSDGQDTAGQISTVEKSTGERSISKPRDSSALKVVYHGSAVTSFDLGVAGGVSSDKLYSVANPSASQDMVKAVNYGSEIGMKVVLFGGGNIHTEVRSRDEKTGNETKEVITVNGVHRGGTSWVRADDPNFTAWQIVRHEGGHERIERGEIDTEKVRARIKEVCKGNFDTVAQMYADAYAGTGMTEDEIWNEIICDSLGDMNIFDAYYAETIPEFKRAIADMVQTAVKTEVNSQRGPPNNVNSSEYAQSNSRAAKAAREIGLEYNAKTESVAPNDMQFSRATWNASDYVQNRDRAIKDITNQLKLPASKVSQYIDDINSIARMIADERERLDYTPALANATALKSDSEYDYTVDFSTLCAKRLLFTGTMNAIQKLLPNTVLDSEAVVKVRQMLLAKGYQAACGICYVESTRREIAAITQEFIDRYKLSQETGEPMSKVNAKGEQKTLVSNKETGSKTYVADKSFTPTLADLNTTDGLNNIRKNMPDLALAYDTFMNSRGQQKPKLLETRTEYKGEILNTFKSRQKVENRNARGGLRLQSYSDFETPHLIDMMQVVLDMSKVGLKSQAYTKVPNFAWVFGNTGVKINLSLIAKGDGVDANGNLLFDDVEGMPFKDAMALRDRYSDNVGTILVGKSDRHIIAAMADDRIDFIIPFHKSQWNASLYDALGLTGYGDYTDYQNEKDIKTNTAVKKNYDPTEYWDYSKTGDENAQIYLEKCREEGRIPKFPQFQGYPGYWKLLIDYKMYNNEGVGVPQQLVRPEFNMSEAQRVMREYEGGADSLPVAQDVVDEFVSTYKEEHNYSRSFKKSQTVRSNGSGMVSENFETPTYLNVSTNHSLLTEGKVLSAATEALDHGDAGNDNAILVGNMPNYLYQLTGIGGDFYLQRDHAYEDMTSLKDAQKEGRARQQPRGHYHGFGAEAFAEYASSIETPVLTINDSTVGKYPSIFMVLPHSTNDGNVICAAIHFYKNVALNGDTSIKPHVLATITEWSVEDYKDDRGISHKGLKTIIAEATKENRIIDKKISTDQTEVAGTKWTGNLTEPMLKENLTRFIEFVNNYRKKYKINYSRVLDVDQSILIQAAEKVDRSKLTKGEAASLDIVQRRIAEINEVRDQIAAIRAKGELDVADKNRIEVLTGKRDRLRAELKNITDKVKMHELAAKAKDLLVEKYGSIAPGEKPAREVSVPRRTNKGNKVSQTVRTAMEAGVTTDEMTNELTDAIIRGNFTYAPITDKEANARAEEKIESDGWVKTLVDWTADMRSGKTTKDNVALGFSLYNNAVTAGDTKAAVQILTDIAARVREGAQAVQAVRILKKLSPEQRLYGIQKSVQSLQEDINDRYGDKAKKIKLDPVLVENYNNAATDEARRNAEKALYENIARQLPHRFIDKWNSWRYLAMLANPRTHIRNIVGNAGFAVVRMPKNAIAAALESAFGIEGRTTSLLNLTKASDKARLNTANDDYAVIADQITGGGKFRDAASEIESMKPAFGTSKLAVPLNFIADVNSSLLDKEDVWFSKPAYAHALARYMKANGITAESWAALDKAKKDKARALALNEAQKATYRDFNDFSNAIAALGRKKSNNKVTKAAQTLMEGVLPFRRTPANILKRGVEYSPIGLIKGIFQASVSVKQGRATAAEAIDRIASGLTGTGIMLLGAFLAKIGLLSPGKDDDEKQAAQDDLTGLQNYALNIGGYSITLDWLAPEALPLFVGAEFVSAFSDRDDNAWFPVLMQGLSRISEPMLEMSMLSSLQDIIENVSYSDKKLIGILSSAATSYLSQALPTIFGQIERVTESQRETTWTDRNKTSLERDIDYLVAKSMNKLPGDYNQIPYIDAWGRTENTGTVMARVFNNLFNPSYISRDITTPVDEELQRLYELGFTDVYPSAAAQKDKIGGEFLNKDEFVKYATERGQGQYKLVEEITSSAWYADLPDADKADIISMAYDYAKQTAQESVRPGAAKISSWVTEAARSGNVAEYIRDRSAKNNADDEAEVVYQDLFDAVLTDGDVSSDISTLLSLGKDEKKIRENIRTHIKEWYQGTDTADQMIDKNTAQNYLVKYGGKTSEESAKIIAEWSCEVETGIAYDDLKSSYVSGKISYNDAVSYLKKYGGKDDADAASTAKKWEFVGTNSEWNDISEEAVAKFNDMCAPAGISKDTYYSAWKNINGIKGDDLDGDGKNDAYTNIDKRLKFINGLSISSNQKTALALSMRGSCSEQTVYKRAPWL